MGGTKLSKTSIRGGATIYTNAPSVRWFSRAMLPTRAVSDCGCGALALLISKCAPPADNNEWYMGRRDHFVVQWKYLELLGRAGRCGCDEMRW